MTAAPIRALIQDRLEALRPAGAAIFEPGIAVAAIHSVARAVRAGYPCFDYFVATLPGAAGPVRLVERLPDLGRLTPIARVEHRRRRRRCRRMDALARVGRPLTHREISYLAWSKYHG